MLRDTYFQSSENPTQVDRLPAGKTALRFLCRSLNSDAVRSAWGICLGVAIGSLILAVTIHALRGLAGPALANVMLVISTLVLSGGLFLGLKKPTTPLELRQAVLFSAAAVMVWCHLNFTIAQELQAIVAAAMLGFVSFSIGEHWIAVCTASPMSRNQAENLRSQYVPFLMVMSALPTLFVLVAIAVGSLAVALVGLVILAVYQTVDAWRLSQGRYGWFTPLEAVRAWFAPDGKDLPGIFQSPSGLVANRFGFVVVAGLALSLVLATDLTTFAADAASGNSSDDDSNPWFVAGKAIGETNLAGVLINGVVRILLAATLLAALPLVVGLPVLCDAATHRKQEVDADTWQDIVRDIRESENPIERSSVYVGRIVADWMPMLVPRKVYGEHAHFLGDSGAGKTSLGLAPLIEQLVAGEPCSVIVLDLKADSLELYATLVAAAEGRKKIAGHGLSLKHFTTEPELSTFAFNPLRQPFLQDLDLYLKTDILCSALGLDYGTDYGEGYYSSANAAVLYQTMKRYPDIRSLREASERVGHLIAHASRKELNPSTRDAGDHVQMVLDRLGSLDALNVTPDAGYDEAILRESIDLSQLFLQPQLLYFHLPSTLAPHTAPEIGRLVASSLLVTAKRTERRHPVYLVIDEFQRMVAKNLEMMLQLARSMGVAVILANQTMEDLRGSKTNLIPAIEGNCRYRQWFSVSLAEDRDRILQASGQTVETFTNTSTTTHPNGEKSSTRSEQQTILPRLNVNDILLASDHPNRSIVRISRGEGYAQLGGMATVVESTYHISAEEYARRKQLSLPTTLVGSFVPRIDKPKATKPIKPRGPIVTTEIIGGDAKPSDIPPSQGNGSGGNGR